MKTTLINFSSLAPGSRIISSYLKKHNHESQMVFFPDMNDIEFNEIILNKLFKIISDSQLIGISLLSINYKDAITITEYVHKHSSIPVVWGGIEIIANPDICIKYADLVCIGEGEETYLELANRISQGKSFDDVKNIWLNKNGKIKKNERRGLNTNLDQYPFPDYDISNHYIFDKKAQTFRKMNTKDLNVFVFNNDHPNYGDFKTYHIITSRGCPHQCTYCSNNILRRVYKSDYIRKRSIPNVIRELKEMTSRFKDVNFVYLGDDTFTLRTEDEILDFSRRYKQEINLPFYISSSPITLTENKFKALIDCGLTHIKIGVQTGSERILREVYKRPTTNEIILKTANMIHKYKKRLRYLCIYDFIFDNPYEDIDDYVKTLELMAQMPRPYYGLYHSLAFFRGTEIYDMAVRDGFIKEREYLDVTKLKSTRVGKYDYIRFFCAMYPIIPFYIPKSITRFLVNKKTVRFLQNKRFSSLFEVLCLSVYSTQYLLQIFYYRIYKNNFNLREIKKSFETISSYVLRGLRLPT